MDGSIPLLAGTISTVIFACSALPMLRKAAVTKDLASYSLGNILLANIGNLVHSLYVFHLPIGPIWVLHGFYVISSGLMLFWYVRFVLAGRRGVQASRYCEHAGRAIAVPRPRRPRYGLMGW